MEDRLEGASLLDAHPGLFEPQAFAHTVPDPWKFFPPLFCWCPPTLISRLSLSSCSSVNPGVPCMGPTLQPCSYQNRGSDHPVSPLCPGALCRGWLSNFLEERVENE